ncbi:dsDNA nuclease domain-containing protein [Achromobacter sp. DH1f]|uniref:dsDNA nuclease domain-containing protein n=1 Tax=Achromobacter sp. DH1f TaxID=1397275 RepID=UPI0009DF6E41|nr:dsDNA nuclease domain-containing protein [Achromobacter sp. DH1f]
MSGLQTELPLQQVLHDLFRDYANDETGGQDASRGFNFQVWHAVIEVLRAFKQGEDFAVVLEWQQDIAVLNSSQTPTGARFLQLKKNERAAHWTLHQISAPEQSNASQSDQSDVHDASAAAPPSTKQSGKSGKAAKSRKTTKPSFLAKLYQQRRRFKALEQSRLEFVSNVKYQVTGPDGAKKTYDTVTLATLDAKILSELEDKIRRQLELPPEENVDFSDIDLLISDCPLTDSHKHATGELAAMQMSGGLQLSGSATMIAVLIIASYVHQRSGNRKFARTFEELLSRAITRTDVSEWLSAANKAGVSPEDQILEIVERMDRETASFSIVRKMRDAAFQACVDILNRAGPVPLMAAQLKHLFSSKNEYDAYGRVTDILAVWHQDFLDLYPCDTSIYSREYLYCLMSMIIQNATSIQHLPSITSSAQSEDEE